MSAAKRHPPAFQIEIGPQPWLQGLIAVLAAVSLLALVAGLAAHAPFLWWLLLLLPLTGWAGWRLARVRPRLLQWDGQTWRLAPPGSREPGPAVQIAVVMDFGSWLLLRSQSPVGLVRRSHYLPLARSGVGPAWGQLRATLYSARPQPPQPV